MSHYPESLRRRDRGVLTLVIGGALLLTPLVGVWAGRGRPWYGPFLLWVILIALGVWNARGSEGPESEDPLGEGSDRGDGLEGGR